MRYIAKAITVGAACLVICGLSSAQAQTKVTTEKVVSESKPQTVCPLTGAPIDKSNYVDYNGYRVYFCCGGCPSDFKKDPEKYIKKMQAEGIVLEKAPVQKDIRESMENTETMPPSTKAPAAPKPSTGLQY